MFSKRPAKKKTAPASAPTPLTAKQRALQEQEAKLQAEMERCRKLVEDAPRIAEEQRRRQREEIINRASASHRPVKPTSLTDRVTTLHSIPSAPTRDPVMRRERRQGRLMFFVLLLTLAGAVYYLYQTVTGGH